MVTITARTEKKSGAKIKTAFGSVFSSMRFTMLITYIAVILITLVLMCAYVIGLLSENLYSGEAVDMLAKANTISAILSENWEPDITVSDARFSDTVDNCLGGTDIRGVVVNTSYTVMCDTNKEARLIGKVFMRDVMRSALDGEQVENISDDETGMKLITVAVPINRDGNIIGCVYLAESIENISGTIKSTRNSLIVFCVLILVLIGMLSIGMSYIITSPVEDFIDAAKRISRGDFSKRLDVRGHNEISQMGEALNFMCDELSSLEEKRRKFVSDASHELKTPMAGIKLICDSLVSAENPDMETVKEFLGDMSDEVDRLTRIVERLLSLTKLDSDGTAPNIEDADIKLLTDEVVRKLNPIAAARSVVLKTDYHDIDFGPVRIDYDKIYEAVYNIVDNAIKYSPEGSTVSIDLIEGTGAINISVRDCGPGIPEDSREKIFERFYRLDDSRARETGGTGLGLAIANEAVTAHGGEITVTDAEGGGSIFTVTLPYKNK